MAQQGETNVGRTYEQRLAALDQKFGPGQGATKERAKLAQKIRNRDLEKYLAGFRFAYARSTVFGLEEDIFVPDRTKCSPEYLWGWAFGIMEPANQDVCRARISMFLGQAQFAPILWNGGWDSYLVDPSSVRDMTEAEIECHSKVPGAYWPTVCGDDTWLRCYFLAAYNRNPQKCVRILMHLGGGD
ncbi:MAG: hypothetical protein WCW26_00230 [Candidatus Buchananbacteria bacterium]